MKGATIVGIHTRHGDAASLVTLTACSYAGLGGGEATWRWTKQ